MSQSIYHFAIAEIVALVALIISAARSHMPAALQLRIAFMLFLCVWGAITFIDCYKIGQSHGKGDWAPLIAFLIAAFHAFIVFMMMMARERRTRTQ